MAIAFCDGFDYYNDASYQGNIWDTADIGNGFAAGRFGGQCNRRAGGNLKKTLTSQQTWIVTFAAQKEAAFSGTGTILECRDGSTLHLDLRFDASGHLLVTRNGTTLGTSTVTLFGTTWYHVQFKFKIDDTTGTYEVRLDGLNVLSGSNVDTRNGGNASVDNFNFVFTNVGWKLDDVIILDTTGSTNNNFPGDCKITTVFPSAAGNSAAWTPSTGSNWQNVDDNPSNGDTDYNSSSTVGQKDTHNCTDVTVTGAILAVKHNITHRKDDAGTRQVCGVVRSGTTDFDGTTRTCASSYVVSADLYETDPNTAAAWTNTNFNAAQFGYKVIA